MGSVHTTPQSSSVPVRDGLAVVLATVVLVPGVNALGMDVIEIELTDDDTPERWALLD